MNKIKQIMLSIILLAVALALVIGVIIPLFEHGADTGDKANTQGRLVIERVGAVFN